MPTIHVLYPHHTIANDEFSHCAFTGKARRFAAMMKPYGYTVHEYSNAGSQSAADVKHVMLNEAEFKAHFTEETSSPGAQANPHTPAGMIFRTRLARALAEYAKPGDIVAHIWTAYWELVRDFPRLNHFETGIGYPNDGIGAYRIFESYAWMHFHWGRYCTPGGVIPMNQQSYDIDKNSACTWVVPNYYDPADWPYVDRSENYVVFMARFVVDKGIEMLTKVIKEWHKRHPDDGMKFVLAGMGGYPAWLAASDFTPAELARIDYRGVVNGPARAVMVGKARAMLLPSIFVEPFGGSGVESMLCFPANTPVRSPAVQRTYARQYTGPLLKIRARGGDVECTPEHPFWTDRGWLAAKNIRVGDCVARSAGHAWPESVHEGRIGDLVAGLPHLRHPYHGEAAAEHSSDAARGGADPDASLYEWASVEAVEQREVADLPVFNLGTSTGTYEAAGFLVHNCGTPLISPDFGAFTETVEDGATGFRCRTVDDYVRSIEDSVNLDRSYVSERAQDRYSLKACGAKYHDIFQRVTTRAGVVW